jgi:putative YhdH/YhfP family quinone oxidoreductase
MPESFKAYRVDVNNGQVSRSVETLSEDSLPPGDVTVEVHYSSLNYKDALSASGNKGVTQTYPHTPGIDAAGVVQGSQDARFKPGDEVIVTSYDLGMNTPGGFGQLIRVPADWVVPLPQGLTLREAMVLGTAGFTAALGVEALEHQGVGDGSVLVTGASGGVGSLAVALLAKAGYVVTASSGKRSAHDVLLALGAAEVIGREAFSEPAGRPLLSDNYAGAVDTVGGRTLENIVKMLHIGASVAACGNVGGAELNLTVYPFILRGVSLLGIDSQHCPMEKRQKVWQKLGGEWKLEGLEDITREIRLGELDEAVEAILKGQNQGRVLVKVR